MILVKKEKKVRIVFAKMSYSRKELVIYLCEIIILNITCIDFFLIYSFQNI